MLFFYSLWLSLLFCGIFSRWERRHGRRRQRQPQSQQLSSSSSSSTDCQLKQRITKTSFDSVCLSITSCCCCVSFFFFFLSREIWWRISFCPYVFSPSLLVAGATCAYRQVPLHLRFRRKNEKSKLTMWSLWTLSRRSLSRIILWLGVPIGFVCTSARTVCVCFRSHLYVRVLSC